MHSFETGQDCGKIIKPALQQWERYTMAVSFFFSVHLFVCCLKCILVGHWSDSLAVQ